MRVFLGAGRRRNATRLYIKPCDESAGTTPSLSTVLTDSWYCRRAGLCGECKPKNDHTRSGHEREGDPTRGKTSVALYISSRIYTNIHYTRSRIYALRARVYVLPREFRGLERGNGSRTRMCRD